MIVGHPLDTVKVPIFVKHFVQCKIRNVFINYIFSKGFTLQVTS